MTRLRLLAPAKINWTLEVLGKRPDGYHEVRSVLQTISLADAVILTPADELSLSVRGASGELQRRSYLAPESNLAYRAAEVLKERTGYHSGAEISLAKYIPVAAGLGGGSSDAAAVLRGLRRLWGLDLSDDELAAIGGEVGSDVPFFLRGGTALASGRGDVLEALPDPQPQRLIVAEPKASARDEKTARMYSLLRPEHYTDGSRSAQLAAQLRTGEPAREEDVYNVFERVLSEAEALVAEVFERLAKRGVGPAHLCGSGPAAFFLDGSQRTASAIAKLAGDVYYSGAAVRTLSAAQALEIQELP